MRAFTALLASTCLLSGCCPPAPKQVAIVQPTPPPPPLPDAPAPPAVLSLEALQQGVSAHGFTPTAVYLDGAGQRMGARLVHDQTKFTFDYLRIESAPQGFIWVSSYPNDDRGEPHTQEHLLLGKGDRGRKMGSYQSMALAESSAFTDQWYTAYHFNTVAAPETFWPVFGDQLGALLDPDYTDEEIRREVRNFGVDVGAKGVLRLEEKGTVYNEMVRTYENPETSLWRTAGRLVYGTQHPLSYDSGGLPEAIRAMTPENIRAFHAANYHLANMGMIAAFPSAMALPDVLDHMSEVLNAATQRQGKTTTDADLPAPAGQPAATVVVDYPYSDATHPSPVMLAWPADRGLDGTGSAGAGSAAEGQRGSFDLTDRTLLDLFLGAFAGDETTTLYKRLVDSKARVLDVGATGVGAYQSNDQGHPIYLSIDGVHADKLDAASLDAIRKLVLGELQRIAKLPPGDPELVAFDERVASRVVDLDRQLAKFLDTPPRFGYRGTGSGWMYQLAALAKVPGFEKSLTLAPQLDAIRGILAAKENPWATRLQKWGLFETPHAVAARPSPDLRKQIDKERDGRITAELARLQKQYGTKNAAETLKKYQAEYDAESAKLEEAARATPLPPLVATPPMTLDEGLVYAESKVGRVPVFTATFDSMQSSRVSLAMSLTNRVPEDEAVYLAAFPDLLSEVGVRTPDLTAEDMAEKMRKEILGVQVYYDENPSTHRLELVVSGAGNTAAETTTALKWMESIVATPRWTIENLPRLRDVVDQDLAGTRRRMQGAEESWVEDPETAWEYQDWGLHLHATSFLTQAHDLHRLRWQLLDPQNPAVVAEVQKFFGVVGTASKLPRAQLQALADTLAEVPKAKAPGGAGAVLAAWKALSPGAKALAKEAGKDLSLIVPDLPDGSIATDWAYLSKQMAADLGVGAPKVFEKLNDLRQRLEGGPARYVVVGSKAAQTAIAGKLEELTGLLQMFHDADVAAWPKHAYVTERLGAHDKTAATAAYVGLFAPATSSGVFLNRAPSTSVLDTSDDKVLDYLASNLYTGHGAHSLFMKTWAAGLAYSNGVHPLLAAGEIEYYAERCPLLPQTMAFVISQVKAATPDENIARYAIAKAFTSRVADAYEERAWALAGNLADGVTPDVVRAFRTKLLAQTQTPDLAQKLFSRLPAVYGRVMPGYGTPSPHAINFVIGPAKQLDAYQTYLQTAVGKGTTLHRLYPRDFWIPATLP